MFNTDSFCSFYQKHDTNDLVTVPSTEYRKASAKNKINNINKNNHDSSSCTVSKALIGDLTRFCAIVSDGDWIQSTLSEHSLDNSIVAGGINEEDHRQQVELFTEYAIKAEVMSLSSFDSFDPEKRHLECSARRDLATPIIHEKIQKGYTVQNMPCLKCRMPLMERHGVVDCQLCPILVQKSQHIEKAIDMKRLKLLEQSLKDAEQDVKETETVVKAEEEEIQRLNNELLGLVKQHTILFESAMVAEEHADFAIKKSSQAHYEVQQAQKLSDEAWAHVSKMREAFHMTKLDCKATLQVFVARIDHTMQQRQQVNEKMTALVKKANDEQSIAIADYTIAKENENNFCKDVNAEQDVQLAQMKQKEADIKFKEAQKHAKYLANELQTKAKTLQDFIKETEDSIEQMNHKVEATIEHASNIEKQTELNIERVQVSKQDAETQATNSNDTVQYKEVRARVTERLAHLANENKHMVCKEYEDAKEELSRIIDYDIPKAEKEVYVADINLKQLITLERDTISTKLRRDIQFSSYGTDCEDIEVVV